jgi:uncharacterized membrane protein YeaQ/YmgE (transglycosylase-associated protein family)
MNFLSWILFGLITGIIANMLDARPKEGSIFIAMLFGVGGALLGGLVANYFFHVSLSGFNLTAFLIAVVGSLAVLVLSRTFRKV